MADSKKQNIIQTVKDYSNRLFGFIRGKVNTDEDAEDILQDVWYQFTNTSATQIIEQVSGWLFAPAAFFGRSTSASTGKIYEDE